MKKSFLHKNSKIVIYYFITVAISLIFIDEIIDLLFFVGSFFNTDKVTFVIGFITLFILFTVNLVILIQKEYIFGKFTNFIFFLFVFYFILFRFFYSDKITFLPSESYLKYADAFILVGSLYAVLFFIILEKRIEFKNNNATNSNNFFLEDSVYYDGELDNEKILEKLISVLKDFRPIEAFSIGLNGTWGYGKTSFLHRFKKIYTEENPDTVIFWYRLWKNKGSIAIIENFFEELKNNLKPHSEEFSTNIDKYVETILSMSPSDLAKIVNLGKDFLSENKTLENYHSTINDSIKMLDRQVIILLDDMDRLDKNEILISLKLMRTLSDFNNVIFITGYDRHYIEETISPIKRYYLDKIFNVELNLLPFDEIKIIDSLIHNFSKEDLTINTSNDFGLFDVGFKNLFIQNELPSFGEAFGLESDFTCTAQLFYKDFLESYRDSKRFINEFKFNLLLFKNTSDIIATDYILLRLFLYRFRELANSIFLNIDDLLEKGMIDTVNKKVSIDPNFRPFDIYVYTEKSKERVNTLLGENYSENEKRIIHSVLCNLFGEKTIKYYKENQNCISKAYYTNIYIRNDIAGAAIAISEFKIAFEKNELDLIVKKIESLKPQSQASVKKELRIFLLNIKIVTKTQFESVIKTLNRIMINNSIEDNIRVIGILNFGLENIYNKNRDEVINIFIELLRNSSIEYFDNLLSEININSKRKERNSLYGEGGIVLYDDNFFSDDEIKKLLIGKLNYLHENKYNVKVVFGAYTLYTEKIVVKLQILRSYEGNQLLKRDIENRPHLYLIDKLFDFNSYSIPKHSIHSTYKPNDFICQVFSNKEDYESLLEDFTVQENFDTFENNGWVNYSEFLRQLEEDPKMENSREMIGKVRMSIDQFIENGYRGLTYDQYVSIWGPIND